MESGEPLRVLGILQGKSTMGAGKSSRCCCRCSSSSQGGEVLPTRRNLQVEVLPMRGNLQVVSLRHDKISAAAAGRLLLPPAGIFVSSGFYVMLFLFLLPCFFSVGHAIYCDDEDCYEILKLKQTATPAEIKKAYYKLSLQYHPDKNKDPDAQKIFAKIATAYEILWNEKTRADYDYFLAHPEEVFYNTMQYYRRYVGHQADVRAVAVGFLLVLSAVQYAAAWGHYKSVIEAAKQTPAYRNKLKALEWERTGGMVSRKKGGKGRSKAATNEEIENLEAELEVQVHGADKPTLWVLVGMRVVLLPYVIGRFLLWEMQWIIKYGIKKDAYAWQDAAYLTRRALGYSEEMWWSIGHARRERLVDHQIWIPANRFAFKNAQRESRRQH